jgi:8-oxo-dGTP diphosphatase
VTDEIIKYTADVVVVTLSRQILLIERNWDPYEGYWALPGGHVDQGETSRDAAARELAEETGLQVAPYVLHQVGIFDHPDRDPRGRYVTVAYTVSVPDGCAIEAGSDARTVRWWPLNDLPRLAFDHADIINFAM